MDVGRDLGVRECHQLVPAERALLRDETEQPQRPCRGVDRRHVTDVQHRIALGVVLTGRQPVGAVSLRRERRAIAFEEPHARSFRATGATRRRCRQSSV